MFLFCNEDRKKKERLNSVLQTTRNLIKKNDNKDVRKNPVYSLIRAMSNYHLYDIVRELYEDEEVTDVQSIYKDIGEPRLFTAQPRKWLKATSLLYFS